MTRTVLILGGTGEARALAAALDPLPGVRVVSSLAGRVRDPRLPVGEVREGGFGGADGLARWLREHAVDAVVDATHPFAARMTASAVEAAAATGTPLLVLRRPGWREGPGDDWRWAGSAEEAAALLPGLGERIFLTTGRTTLAAYAGLDALWFLVRAVDPPQPPLPRRSLVVLDRGPYTVAGELALMREHRIEVLVTKDSGGEMTSAKLAAARELGLPAVVVRRPPAPEGVPLAATVAEALEWLAAHAG
ncbi:precorrin-6A/cobalt-precorrin-6A reductase [Thermocatellispora tengchongensis]|uniref:Precorrin-6A/cobalt-precorrin-6A reductase n=1 Tax=Thermocatellispora tengchongensis TaxID=1073253 RepID=A0A840PB00_9ACTN|nr:cobalt-precorrin-6A reductase [Thermocatellispora tengchongensis]MBB5136422.1 precorrin-6A/cobalt-precorrin-6A reductase [Thermocatellispora tengchongensis]